MPVITSQLTAVFPAIDFPCIVKGKPLIASLTHMEYNPINIIYVVSFSDGYESQFLIKDYDPDSLWIDMRNAEKRKGEADISYAKAISPDLNALCGFTLHQEIHLIVMDVPTEAGVNVWVQQDRIEPWAYSVYYKNDYRFTLERLGKRWKAYSRRQVNPEKLSELVVHYITSQIDAKMQ
jgi:hypothetical protein